MCSNENFSVMYIFKIKSFKILYQLSLYQNAPLAKILLDLRLEHIAIIFCQI